jgi:preprotein translocase subunit SecA
MEILHHVNQALKAHTIFKRDRDYVVQGGKVVIVDEQTGRLMSGRRWSDGLHQAVEAKEKVEVEAESQTYATITFQNYFRMYTKLAGMTGTAETEAEEFQKIYNLDVVVVPTNRPITRDDHHDIVYKTQGEKFRAVLDEIEASHKKGQPVLVGTVSVEKSDIVSRLLRQRGIPHELLNAKQHAREAEIVSQAGRIGSVTISTNMAGRGTDIKLGGDPEGLAKLEAHPELQPEAYKAAHARFAEQCSAERERVLAVGGLHILGTERHESRRIDNQLRGRAGRQGDPGSSRFYLSLEDDLLRIFGGDKLVGWMERMGMQEDERIEHRWITSSIENAQKKVEGHNFNIRKNLLEYDDVMNLQRRAVYDMRRKALLGESIREMVVASVDALIDDVLDECVQEGVTPEQWNVEGFRERLDKIFTLQWDETDDGLRDHAWEEIRQRLITEAHRIYEERESAAGAEAMRQVERMLLLQFTDSYWKDHLLAMDRLRDGIGLRGYGQKNPLLEYKKEGTEMFLLMNSLRDEAVVSRLLRLEIQAEAAPRVTKANARRLAETPVGEPDEEEIDPSQLLAVAPQAPPARPAPPPPPAPVRPQPGTEARAFARLVGLKRNEPCPCGSGKKYKKCCYDEAEDEAVAAAEAAAAEAAAEAAAAGEEVDPAAPLVVSAEAAAELPTEPPAELPAEAAAGGETGVGFEGESTVLASVEGGAPAFGGSVADPDLLAPTEAPTETIDLGRRDA